MDWEAALVPDREPTWHGRALPAGQRLEQLDLRRRPFSGLCARLVRDARAAPTPGAVALCALYTTPRQVLAVLADGEAWVAGPGTGDPVWTTCAPYAGVALLFDPPHDPAAGVEWVVALRSTALDHSWPRGGVGHAEAPRRAGEAPRRLLYATDTLRLLPPGAAPPDGCPRLAPEPHPRAWDAHAQLADIFGFASSAGRPLHGQ